MAGYHDIDALSLIRCFVICSAAAADLSLRLDRTTLPLSRSFVRERSITPTRRDLSHTTGLPIHLSDVILFDAELA